MRYPSLDFFRGLTIALMIVVNDPGTWSHVYAPLRHAAWHGCTPTDLVFPSFLFIVGVAMWFSFSKFNGQMSAALARKILRRTALIFLVGLALNAYPFFNKDWSTLRIMGVLQRIGLAYGLAAFLCISLKKRHLIVTTALMLVGYWLMMWLCATGDPYALETNLARWFDAQVLSEAHLYKGFGIAFDPEGLLSTLPAAATAILGYLTGGLIAQNGENKARLVRDLSTWGAGLVLSGWLWGLIFPINKPLWTSSYVLYAGGWAMLVLALCVWVLDIRGWQRAAKPFLVFGANPLFAFVLSGLLVKTLALFKYQDAEGKTRNAYHWIYQHIFYPIDAAEFGSLLFALCYATVIWAVCWVLWRRKIFIKI
jgi:predicted acyltransferase